MRRLLLFLAFIESIHAVGSVSQSFTQIPNSNTWVLAVNWIGDSVNGSVPATVAQFGLAPVQGFRPFSMETAPGVPAPTNFYNVTITTFLGDDILLGAGTALSNTIATSIAPPISTPPLYGTLTINITGNSVPSAQGRVLIYFAPLSQIVGLTGGPSLNGPNTFTGTNTFTGINSFANINSVIYVDGVVYPRNDAGVQAALTALHAQGGGRLYLTDGNYSTLTTTITLNCKEELFLGVMNPAYTLTSSASPVINMTGTGNSPPNCGTAVRGISRFTSSITGNGGTTADVINVGASCNSCVVENLRITGITQNSRDTIRIQDNQRNLTIQHLQLGPNGECINYIPGGNGFNIITIEDVRCDGWTGSGMDFRLNGNANGTNLRFMGGYLANGLSSPVSYDLNGVQAILDNTAEDHSVANSIGVRIGTTATNRGCIEMRNIQVEGTGLASQTGIQISGSACVVIISPYINTDGTPISITAATTQTTIVNPATSGTANANSIVYGASVTGQHILIGKTLLDKAILNSSGVIIEEHDPNYVIFPSSIGSNLTNGSSPTFPLELNVGGTGNTVIGLDRGAAFKWRLGNEGAANGVCVSSQDDFCLRSASTTQNINFSTDNGATDAMRILANDAGIIAKGSGRGGIWVADQGTACTNGELALSAGWQSTGSATVTAVAGNGQTCSWTITTGTTTAANPTVTDTLTNPLPAATTVCEMNIHGGTHTAAAGEGFQQTTLSATAPIFTFNGTPTAGGTTYFITRLCGP